MWSLWVAEDRSVLGQTTKDRERPSGNTTERSAKTICSPQPPSKTEFYSSDHERPSAKTKEKTLSDPERPSRS